MVSCYLNNDYDMCSKIWYVSLLSSPFLRENSNWYVSCTIFSELTRYFWRVIGRYLNNVVQNWGEYFVLNTLFTSIHQIRLLIIALINFQYRFMYELNKTILCCELKILFRYNSVFQLPATKNMKYYRIASLVYLCNYVLLESGTLFIIFPSLNTEELFFSPFGQFCYSVVQLLIIMCFFFWMF